MSPCRPRFKDLVDSVALTKNLPILAIGGQDFTLDKIKRVLRAAS